MPQDLKASMPDAYQADSLAVAASLGVDPGEGLTADEVARRAAITGPNDLEPEQRPSVLAMIWDSATEPFIILLFVAGLAAVALGEVRDGLLILVALVPIIGADVVTEYRGERALEALRAAAAPQARVRRGGLMSEVPAADLVPGDIVLIRAGDVVPADLRLAVAERLLLDRSSLTGESVPEAGSVEADPTATPLVDRRAMAYAGMGVVGGRAEGIVVAIGQSTEVGRIASGLVPSDRRRSPLQAELDRLVRILLVVAVGLVVIVTGLGFARGQDAGANVLAGISAAIAAIPEEPPILLAVVLGLGAYRLLRRGVLVRRLNAEETLGAVDLIITDKTGTLTKNRLQVASIRTPEGRPAGAPERLAILGHAVRAEDDAWAQGRGATLGSFTRAIVEAIQADGGRVELDLQDLVEAEPADDARRYARTLARDDMRDAPAGADGRLVRILGAPEAVVALAQLDADRRAAWGRVIDAGAEAGERLLGLALGPDDRSLRMAALIGFADPLRDDIRAAFDLAAGAGISTIVVTGDHPRTAQAIAQAAGLHDGAGQEAVALGDGLAALDDAALTRRLPDLRVIARSTPDGKERLVRLAREAGRTVAVTGDGVNDAPALQRADVAVAMGSGTAVAKGASDLVLGDNSFTTLLYGLAEGRRIVDNVQKGLVFLISTHVALLGFILIATLAGFGQPLLPLQILWLELFIDISASIAFERESPEPDLMQRPPRHRGIPLLDDGLLARIAVAGGFSAVAALVIMLAAPGSPEHVRWLAYTSLVCAQVVRAYANRSLRTPIHRLPRNGFLLGAVLIVLLFQALIPYVPLLSEAFRASPLAPGEWVMVALIALSPALVAESWRMIRGTRWVA